MGRVVVREHWGEFGYCWFQTFDLTRSKIQNGGFILDFAFFDITTYI